MRTNSTDKYSGMRYILAFYSNIITQYSCFLTLADGITLDSRLYYAPPVIAALANPTEGNVSTVTGETLRIHPLYLVGHVQPDHLLSIAEVLKLIYAEMNPKLANDDVQVAIVNTDDGVASIRQATFR